MDAPAAALAWDPAVGAAVTQILVAAALFVVFHYRFDAVVCQRFVASRRRATERGAPGASIERGAALPPGGSPRVGLSDQAAGVLLRRFAGGVFLLLGVLAVEALFGRPGASLALPHPAATLLLGLAPMLVVGPVLALAARGPAVQALQPEIRDAVQPPGLVALSVLGWGFYLLGYEHLFRGPLLVSLAAQLGVWPALTITAALYSFAHLGKPLLGEALLSLPMGLLFGVLALHTGGVWAPWLLHLAIAATTEVAAGRAHPAIAYGRPV